MIINTLLDKLSKFFQLDLRYYVKNAPYLFMSEGVAIICSLATTMAFTRLVPQDTFGQYNYLTSILGILLITSVPGMATAIQQAVARGHDRVFVDGTKTRMKWSLLGSVAAFSIGLYYYFNGSLPLAKALMASALFFPLYSSADSFLPYLWGKANFPKASIYSSILQVVSAAVLIIVIFFSEDLLFIAVAGLGSLSLARFYFLRRTMRREELNQSTDKESFTFARNMTFLGIIPTAGAQYDRIIIANFLGFQNLAIYAIARAGSHFLDLFRSIVMRIAFPRMAALETEEAISAVKKKGLYLWIAHGILVAIGIVIMPYVVPLLFTQAYYPAVLYTRILFAASLLAVPAGIFAQLFKSQRATRQLYKLGIFTQVLRIVLLTILVPLYGLLGAVLVTLIVNASESVLAWWLIREPRTSVKDRNH